MSGGDPEQEPATRTTNALVDQRVARVETDLSQLRTELTGFRELVGERFHGMGEALRRIEAAVTAPSSTDAATAVVIADLSRRMHDQEARSSALAAENTALRNELTATRSQLATVAAGLRFVGFGGVIALIGLVAGYVVSNGRIP